jgi:predicted PurR-regulated permease PerM
VYGGQHVRRATLSDRKRLRRTRSLRLPLRILMLLAIGATLVLARALVIPLVLAGFIALALNPIVAGLRRIYVPRPVGALLIMIALVAVLAGASIGISAPAAKWVRDAPTILHEAGAKLQRLTRPLTQASHAASESLANVSGESGGHNTVSLASPSYGGIANVAPSVAVAVLTVALLVFFFLSYGRDVAAHLVTAMPGFGYRRVALRLIRGIQTELSRYLLTVSVINVCLGLVTATMLWALGVPNPMLWGGMATLLNFMPYVGAVTTTLILVFVGLVEFPSSWHALVPAACFAVVAALEGNVITPIIIGGRLRLSPLAILVWLLIWGWMWGIPGALLAVPMLTCLKLTTESLPGWQWFAKMVER